MTVTRGTEVEESMPGHTPRHVGTRISSQGSDAAITGDLLHPSYRMAYPEEGSRFDRDAARARETRRAALAHWAGAGFLVIGTHFVTPTAGRIVREGNAFRFDVHA